MATNLDLRAVPPAMRGLLTRYSSRGSLAGYGGPEQISAEEAARLRAYQQAGGNPQGLVTGGVPAGGLLAPPTQADAKLQVSIPYSVLRPMPGGGVTAGPAPQPSPASAGPQAPPTSPGGSPQNPQRTLITEFPSMQPGGQWGMPRPPQSTQMPAIPAPLMASNYSDPLMQQYAAQLLPLAGLYGWGQTGGLLAQLGTPMPANVVNWGAGAPAAGGGGSGTGQSPGYGGGAGGPRPGFPGSTPGSGTGFVWGPNGPPGPLAPGGLGTTTNTGPNYLGPNNPGGIQPPGFNPNYPTGGNTWGNPIAGWLSENAGNVGQFVGGMVGGAPGALLGGAAGGAVGGYLGQRPAPPTGTFAPTGSFSSPDSSTIGGGGYYVGSPPLFGPTGAEQFAAGGGFGDNTNVNLTTPALPTGPVLAPSTLTGGQFSTAPYRGYGGNNAGDAQAYFEQRMSPLRDYGYNR